MPANFLFPFVMESQQMKHWCWTATAVSIEKYYDPNSGWLQCLLVDDQLHTGTCCDAPTIEKCDKDWRLDWALNSLDHLKQVVGGESPTLRDEINAFRPVAMRIEWNGGGAHFVVIHGYADIHLPEWPFLLTYLNVQDSYWGPSIVHHRTFDVAEFPANYHGGGSWTHSFLTR